MAFNKTAIALAALLMAACISAQLAPVGTEQDDRPQPKPTTTTTTSSTTTTTTTTTTTPATTTTTTTTPATTTTTTSTTPAPVTTTAKPAPPPPVPQPPLNRWTFTDHNVTCLIVQMAAQLNVTYQTNDTAHTNATVLYNLPSNNHTVGGSCTNLTDTLVVDLGNGNRLKLQFGYAINDTQHYELDQVELTVNATQFPNAKANQTLRLVNVLPQFKTRTLNSYHCTRVQVLDLAAEPKPAPNATVVATLAVSRLQFEAFHRTHDDHFSTARDCDAVDTPDIVPIAVGCALVALVVLMLIAYLCARRRSQTHGYLSM